MTNKDGVTYSYPASGASSTRPHTPSSVGGTSYVYDANGNLTSGAGRTYTWTLDNLPSSVSQTSGNESYGYDADGERVKVVCGSTTTIYLEGLWEEVAGGAAKSYYSFNGQVVAVRDRSTNVVTYLHGDHLGSVSVATTGSGAIASQQEYTPFGSHRGSGDITQTSLDYTGQRLDGTGLLYYHARMYDPALGRFVSPDSIVPGAASGAGGGAATLGLDSSSQLTPLTVDFHEPGFVAMLNGETAFRQEKGFWFQLSDEDKQKAKRPWGPLNPQALNRYSYVLNNPVRYLDPSGHLGVSTDDCLGATCTKIHLTHDEATALWSLLRNQGLKIVLTIVGLNNKGLSALVQGLRSLGFGGAILAEIAQGLAALGIGFAEIVATLTITALAIMAADYYYNAKL